MRLIAQAEAALTEEPPNSSDLELAVANLNRKLEVLTPLDAEILELTLDDDIEAEIDHADQYQESIRRTLSKLNKALLAATAPMPGGDLDQPHHHQQHHPLEIHIQLILRQ